MLDWDMRYPPKYGLIQDWFMYTEGTSLIPYTRHFEQNLARYLQLAFGPKMGIPNDQAAARMKMAKSVSGSATLTPFSPSIPRPLGGGTAQLCCAGVGGSARVNCRATQYPCDCPKFLLPYG
jgi:hypothetical protein